MRCFCGFMIKKQELWNLIEKFKCTYTTIKARAIITLGKLFFNIFGHIIDKSNLSIPPDSFLK